MERRPPFVVAACAHPSLDGAVQQFCDDLRAEPRYFGRRSTAKPPPSLVRRLEAQEPDLCLAAVADGHVIGMARLDESAVDGAELLVAVAEPWRGRGVALALGRVILERAHDAGFTRIVLRTCRRPSELRELGDELGFIVVDIGQGRLELVRILADGSRSA